VRSPCGLDLPSGYEARRSAPGGVKPEATVEAGHLGGDILADKLLSKEEARAALCQWLSLPPEAVFVYEDWREIPEQLHGIKAVCQLRRLPGGDFQTVIEIPDSILHELPRITAATALSKLLGCRLLVDDGSVNPYSWLVVNPSGDWKRVSLEPEAFDKDECVISDGAPE
jgi:hypothetical protein